MTSLHQEQEEEYNLRLLTTSGQECKRSYSGSATVGDIKDHLEGQWPEEFSSHTLFPGGSLKLILAGKILSDDTLLCDCGIKKGIIPTVHVVPSKNPPPPRTPKTTSTSSPSPSLSSSSTSSSPSPSLSSSSNPFFAGSVTDAIQRASANQTLFVVVLLSNDSEQGQGEEDTKQLLETTLNNEEVVRSLSQQSIAIKITDGSPDATQFREIFKVEKVPSIYFIGRQGLISSLVGYVPRSDFMVKFNEAKKADLHVLAQQLIMQGVQSQVSNSNNNSHNNNNNHRPSAPAPAPVPASSRASSSNNNNNNAPSAAPLPSSWSSSAPKINKVRALTSEGDLDRELLAAKSRLVVVDFMAQWCGPCKKLAPFVDQLALDYPNVVFLKVDVDQLPGTAARCEIKAMPTFRLYIGNDVVEKFTGADPQLLERQVRNWYNYVESKSSTSSSSSSSSSTTSSLAPFATATLPSSSSSSSSAGAKQPLKPTVAKPASSSKPDPASAASKPAPPASASSKPVATTKANVSSIPAPAPPKVYTSTQLAIRLTNGFVLRHEFQAADTLQDVMFYIDVNRNDGAHKFRVKTTHPCRDYVESEYGQTLSKLDLVPSATLTCVSVDPNARPSPAPGDTSSSSSSSGSASSSGSLGKIGGLFSSLTSTVSSFLWTPTPSTIGSDDTATAETGAERKRPTTATGPEPETIGNDNQNSNQQQDDGLKRRGGRNHGAGGNVHQLHRDDEDEQQGGDKKDKDSYWNGNSTQFQ
eukprot:TRINITY_DN7714_c0_g1_i2.p1 TRINITY_DN7714_c0_g1~~TRINITY_DN7714_c0_g1_i2.p1  ORF type:complete len:753 (+),score=213.96 TRINITY_DN7714_c0_g1_i2:43-2301(+)